jgi:soluble lytic murein transglycosylase-like protein
MPRARSINQDQRQAAAASENGSGCFSVYWMPPLAALFIACLLAIFALRTPLQTSALDDQVSVLPATTSTPIPQTGSLPLPVVTQALPVADNSALVVPTSAVDTTVVSEAPRTSTNPFFSFTIPASPTLLSPVFSKEVQYWAREIVRWANDASLDPNLVAVVMQIESCGNPRAISRSGAIGLFQVMPFHFHLGDNPFNPDTNALRGLDYLSRSLAAAGGNARLALAGYNGGIGVISRAEWTWPSETQRYVQIGAPIYEDAHSGAASSAAFEQWYGSGNSLCRHARNQLGITE